jgi:LPXTG-site transpeptidase (sortase) family protein
VKEYDLSPYLFSSTINYKWVIVGPDTMAYMPGGSMLANFESDTLISQNIKPLFQSSGSKLLFGDYTRPLNCSVSSGDPVLDASAGSFPPSVSPPSAYFMQFQVGNQGDADVTNVRVTVPLPANLDVNAVNITYRTYVGSGSDSGYSSSITDNNIMIVFNRITSNDVYNIQVSTNVVEGSPASVSTINAAIVSYDRVAGDTGCGDLMTNNTSPFNLNILGTRLIEPYAPDTGFAPGRVTAIPERPESLEYQKLDEVRLKIPNLRMDVPIVGIPYINDWNITWLSNNAGWLEGTSYMGGAGNSVLVGHNYLPSGESGPFIHLAWLRKNDLIYVEQGNQLLVYKVKYVGVVNPDNPLIFQNENTSTLTLVTCKDYDAQTDVYLKRIVVKATLMEVRSVKAGAPILNSLMALLIDFIDRNES